MTTMPTYLLPDADVRERALAKMISGAGSAGAEWKTFPCGEHHVLVRPSGTRACVIGRTAPPADDLVRTLLLVDAVRRSGAGRVSVLLPYFGYSRQDRAQLPGEAVSSLAVIGALASAGASEIVTADLHSQITRESSPIPVRSVSVVPELAAAVRRAVGEGTCTVVAPDHGARHRADLMAAALGQRSEASWIQKFRHPATGRVTAQGIVGPVPGGTAVIVDDILDTGKTVDLAVRLLRRRGFDRLFLVITHALMSGDAPARMRRLRFEKIVAADTVPLRKEAARLPGMTVVKVGRRLADAVLQAA